jgi:predicted  nucleic acid-binding Zn-ribbon protein
MVEPNRLMEVLLQIRADIRRQDQRIDHEFSEIRDSLRRIDERIDGLVAKLEKIQ